MALKVGFNGFHCGCEFLPIAYKTHALLKPHSVQSLLALLSRTALFALPAHSHGRARLSPSLIPCSRFHQSEVALLLCTSAHSRCAITTLLLAAILVPALPFLPVAAVLPLPSLTGVLASSARVRYPRRRRSARR